MNKFSGCNFIVCKSKDPLLNHLLTRNSVKLRACLNILR